MMGQSDQQAKQKEGELLMRDVENGNTIFGDDPYRSIQTAILERVERAGEAGAKFDELTHLRLVGQTEVRSIQLARSAIIELGTLGLVAISDDWKTVRDLPRDNTD